jgi:endoglucanase
MHHYRQLEGEALDDQERPVDDAVLEERFVAMWTQIATRYADQPDTVLFELYNEPHNSLTADRWNALFPRALAAVRATNPERFVVIGPTDFNNPEALTTLRLPASDSRLIATVHSYAPFDFTHQGAPWVGSDSTGWLGTKCCSTAQVDEMAERMDIATKWSATERRPIWLGEFGSYEEGDPASRARYTRTARDLAETRGFSWAYWEFGGGYGIYDDAANTWREPLRDALIR